MSDTNGFMSITDDGEVQVAFEAAVMQVAISLVMIKAMVKSLMMKKANMVPVVKFLASFKINFIIVKGSIVLH